MVKINSSIASTVAPPKLQGKRNQISKVLLVFAPIALPIAIIVLWHTAVFNQWVPNTLIASPRAVGTSLLGLMADGTLLEHIGASLRRLFSGFGLGAIAGLMMGCLLALSRQFERLVEPTISSLAPIPPTAWIPLLIILLGFGEASKIWLIAIGVFFVVVTNTVSGIRGVESKYVEVAQIYQKNRLQILTDVLLPASSPSILTGLRVGLGLAWILLIAAELISAQNGLGWFIYDSRNFSRPDDMFSGMIVVGILGMICDRIMRALQYRMLRWQSTFAGD